MDPQTGDADSDEVFPTICWMGSGYEGVDGYYWNSSVIWDHLLRELLVKERKETSVTEEEELSEDAQGMTNHDVYEESLLAGGDTDENNILEEEDFYYGDDYRFGSSRLVEVYGWLVKDGTNVKVEMNPMFSYAGDLGFIEPLEEDYKDSSDVYTFAAINSKGKIIVSPVDGKFAAKEF